MSLFKVCLILITLWLSLSLCDLKSIFYFISRRSLSCISLGSIRGSRGILISILTSKISFFSTNNCALSLHKSLLHRLNEIFEIWNELHRRCQKSMHSQCVQEIQLFSLFLTLFKQFFFQRASLKNLLRRTADRILLYHRRYPASFSLAVKNLNIG